MRKWGDKKIWENERIRKYEDKETIILWDQDIKRWEYLEISSRGYCEIQDIGYKLWIQDTSYNMLYNPPPHPYSLSRNTENMKPVGWNIGNFRRHLPALGDYIMWKPLDIWRLGGKMEQERKHSSTNLQCNLCIYWFILRVSSIIYICHQL